VRRAAPLVFLTLLAASSCSRFGPVYPARPSPEAAPALADPEPSRVGVHLAITHDGLTELLGQSVPMVGGGTVPLLGADRAYNWARGALDLSFVQGRIQIQTRVQATLDTPLKKLAFPLDVNVLAEPVVASTYVVKLQAVEVHVTSPDKGIAFADQIAGVYRKIEDPIADKLRAFSHDLRPLLGEAYARVQEPIKLPVGDADACARLEVLEIEAAPTVLADGIEKDVALVVKPSITMPCPNLNYPEQPELPPLSNVASLPTGPSVVTVPIAAKYDELTRAMTMAFTGGKLFFSKDFPEVYLEKPELYESQGQLVLKLHIAGPVHRMGIDTDLDGDLFLSGHPQVVDNELSIPDLQPTIETRNFLLSLKAMTDADGIRDQARAALRLDIGARIRDAQAKLGDQLTFGGKDGCFEGHVDRVDVPGVYPHAGYLRVQVAVTGRARADVPCGGK
jgi:hypothetical protein